MMKMKLRMHDLLYVVHSVYVALIIAALTLIGCSESDPSASDLSEQDFAQIVAEVEEAVWAFHAADTSMNAEGVIDLLWPEYYMFADGQRIEYEDVVAGARAFMPSLSVFYTEWHDLKVTPVNAETAIASFVFRDSIVTKEGQLTQAQGPNTFVWQKREGEWRVLYGDADHYPLEDETN